LSHRIIITLAVALSFSAYSAESTLGTTRIDVALSGSLNTIAGVGTLSFGQITLPTGSTLQNLRITLTDLQITPQIQAPQSIGFGLLYRYPNSSIIDSAGAGFADLSGVQVGSSKIVSPFTSYNFSNPFLGLFTNFGQAIPTISAGASWSFGGINAAGTATFEIDALGSLPPVPEPGTLALLCLGLLGVSYAAGLRNRSRRDA
jgi:hypothetical protein